MSVLILDQEAVRSLMPMAGCIDLMESTLTAFAEGAVVQPLRTAHRLPDGTGLLGLMPGYLERERALGIKVLTVFPGNEGTEFESHQGAVLLFEVEHGGLIALLDAAEVTAIRTAAVSGVATRHLANDTAGDLAILGSGTQAETHLEAVLAVRSLRRIRVWSRQAHRAHRFAEIANQRHGREVVPCPTVEDAVRGADIVCTTTASQDAIVRGEWLAPGAHVNAVGACTPRARELDTDAVKRAKLFVDSRESAEAEAGDYLIPRDEGEISAGHILGEIGEIIAGQIPGRTGPEDVTLFKSLGLAIEDVAAAHYLYSEARRQNVGTTLALGGRRRGLA